MGRAALSFIIIFVSSIPCLGQVSGNALQFDGVDDLVRIPDSNSLDLSSAATIEFWCKPIYPSPPVRNGQRIVNKGDGQAGNTDRAYEIELLQPEHPNGRGFVSAFFLGSDTYTAPFTPYQWVSGTWVHFASTFSLAASEVRTYVDGQLAVVTQTTAGLAIRNSSYPLNIGAYQQPGVYFSGQLDEVRIWNIARSACEIEANYNRQLNPNTPGLVGYWRFDEAGGTQNVLDSSPIGNNGTLGNTSGAASDDPTRVASTVAISAAATDCNLNGISDPCDISSGASLDCNNSGVPDECEVLALSANSAVQFNGSNRLVRVPRTVSLEPTDELSIEVWAHANSDGASNSRLIRLASGFSDGYSLAWQLTTRQVQLEVLKFSVGQSVRAIDDLPSSSYHGRWTHFAGTYSASGGYCRLYVNGVLKDDKPAIGPLLYSGGDLGIGNFAENPVEGFDGQLDEVRIWNLARTQNEIQSTMNRRLTGLEPGLVAYYRFDDGYGGFAINYATQYGVSNATLVNSTAWVESSAPIFEPNSTDDCNNNGIPDDCDIGSGTTMDCNLNGVPDVCEAAFPGYTSDLISLVTNGDFETPRATLPWSTIAAGQTFGGWTVETGNIDVNNSYFEATSGSQTIDMSGQAAGAIYQDVSTDIGQQYLLVFDLAGNPIGGSAVKQLEVSWGGSVVDTPIFDITGHSAIQMGYETHQYVLQASSGLTRLKFRSLTNNEFGPVIDSVCVFKLIPDCNSNGSPDECEVRTHASASAIQFDGVDDHVAIPGFGAIAPTTEITIEFWQKAEAGGEHPAFGLHDGSTTNRLSAFVPWVNGGVYWQFGNRATNGQLSYTPAASILGTWQHFAMVASQAGNYMRIYRNGILEASKSGMTPFVQSSLDFSIGSFREDSTLSSFAGSIDEFRIWGVARSQAQIESTLHKQLFGNEPNLVAYYRFDEGSGLTAINLAAGSAASNGTLTNGPAWITSGASIFEPNPASDCNANGIPDSCDIADGAADCNSNTIPDSCEIAGGAPDCNGDSIPDVCQSGLSPVISTSPQSLSVCDGGQANFSVGVTGAGTYSYQWRKNGAPIDGATNNPLVIPTTTVGDAGSYDVVVTTSCGQTISNPATLTITSNVPATHYTLGTLCPPTAIPNASIIGFTDDGPIADSCFGQRSFRLFAGQETIATGKLTRMRPGCIIQAFGPTLCTPESLLVDVHGRWQGVCSLPNLLIAGACNTVYFINPANGAICEQFPDPTFDHIGQMAIDSMGRLFVGSVDGDSLNVIDMGAVEAFYSAPGMSPRAVAIDAADNVYVTTAVDGVMSKIGSAGMVIDPTFAAGLSGAISQAIAPQGIFHGNMFVACGDRVMEVEMTTGASSLYLSCRAVHGIAFDPEGYMHISIPSENKVLKIGPSLPGDMNGSGAVTIDDASGFAAALLQLPDAPLPIATADMNMDGCADGRDVQLFVNAAFEM